MSRPILQLTNVTKEYGAAPATRVLHEVNLRICRGEFVALVGASGSGKSTLLNILGLLDRPTSGSVMIAGDETTTLDDHGRTSLRGSTLGFVFQFHHLLGELTATENVMLPLAIRTGKVTRLHRQQASAALDAVGLSRRSNASARALSGGEQQRVAIARALIHQPQLLLADEPTGNLDSKTSDDIFELMRKVHQQFRTAFLIVTHAPTLAQRCDRVVTLTDGRIVSDVTNRHV